MGLCTKTSFSLLISALLWVSMLAPAIFDPAKVGDTLMQAIPSRFHCIFHTKANIGCPLMFCRKFLATKGTYPWITAIVPLWTSLSSWDCHQLQPLARSGWQSAVDWPSCALAVRICVSATKVMSFSLLWGLTGREPYLPRLAGCCFTHCWSLTSSWNILKYRLRSQIIHFCRQNNMQFAKWTQNFIQDVLNVA